MFASSTTFRITTFKKKLHSGNKHLKLGSLNITQRSFQPIGWSSPFAKPLLDGTMQFSIYFSPVDWTRWYLTQLGNIFMSPPPPPQTHTHTQKHTYCIGKHLHYNASMADKIKCLIITIHTLKPNCISSRNTNIIIMQL